MICYTIQNLVEGYCGSPCDQIWILFTHGYFETSFVEIVTMISEMEMKWWIVYKDDKNLTRHQTNFSIRKQQNAYDTLAQMSYISKIKIISIWHVLVHKQYINIYHIKNKILEHRKHLSLTCNPQQPHAFIMEALCTTLYFIPFSLALSTRSVWVVALQRNTKSWNA